MNRLGFIKTACTVLDSLMFALHAERRGTDGNGTSLPEGKYVDEKDSSSGCRDGDLEENPLG